MAKNSCLALQKSLEWCQGTPELPGIRRRAYFVSKAAIAKWPVLPKDEKGRPTASTYQGDFELLADQKFNFIDILPDKSQLTSDPQGEVPSQTQLNKLTLLHPGVGEEAAAAAAGINNIDNVFIVQDMKGNWRVVGCEMYETKNTVSQDNGQGATGATSTTISVEATDVIPAPFYVGKIITEEGEIVCSGQPAE